MKPNIIAHRANLHGPSPDTENTLEAIQKCIELNIDMELDLWYREGKFFLGHDKPTTEFDLLNYNFNNSFVWFHCKDIKTLQQAYTIGFYTGQKWGDQYSYFFHDKDDMTLTTKLEFWTYPGKYLSWRSIAVLPDYETAEYERLVEELCVTDRIKGICTDYPLKWLKLIKKEK